MHDTMTPSPIPFLPDLGRRTLVMGILNLTPDSFSDGGDFVAAETAIAHARAMAADGADLIDIGGESTRPGASEVAMEEEIRRVVPVIRTLAGEAMPPLSIDSYKAGTADAALRAGARIVNDIWGLQRDPEMARVAAAHRAAVIIMHNRRQIDPALDIVTEMIDFFARSIDLALKAGIGDADIILDPGIGFGKTVEQQVAALARLPELKAALPFPLLVGASRKSMIAALTGRTLPPKERLAGTLASHVVAIGLGADIIRVHDVGPHVEAARVADALHLRRSTR